MLKQSVCLNMIVKNESHIIGRTLENLFSFIPFSYWVISDTGSTDNTKEVIRDFFKERGVPGELVEHEWRDFGYNRSKALECAYNKSDYLLIFDADDSIMENFVLPSPLLLDRYNFKFGKGFSYVRPLLVNNRKKWCFKGVLHESLTNMEVINGETTISGDYYIESGRLGNRSKNPNKYYDDAIVLEKAFVDDFAKDYPMACRYAFYCAQSYKDAGEKYIDKSIEWYKKCLTLHNWDQEKYYSCLMLGDLSMRKQNSVDAVKYWLKSIEYDQERIEGIVMAMNFFKANDQHLLVCSLFNRFKGYQKTFPKNDKLFLFEVLYRYDMELLYLSCAHFLKEYDAGYACCKELLFLDSIDKDKVKSALSNMLMYPSQVEGETNGKVFERANSLMPTFPETHPSLFKVWDALFKNYSKTLIKYSKKFVKELGGAPMIKPTTTVMISFTTCKRFDLFSQTINSILNTWTDLDKIDYWFCVDDNSSEKDRECMRKLYPWITFSLKTPEEKGHVSSMNIIWGKLSELKPKYWIHMEDDFLFYEKCDYITKSITALSSKMMRDANVKQILFNKNYGEIVDDYSVKGEKILDAEFSLHDFRPGETFPYPNCQYWPHYSFRPSLIDVKTILKLGDYTSPNTFFEMDYAKKWAAMGFKSAFFNKLVCKHIGRLTGHRGEADKKNAYMLNEVGQFAEKPVESDDSFSPIKIINLARRPDRREKTVDELLAKGGVDIRELIKLVEFVDAVDGKTLEPTYELAELFKGNDFGNRRGVIGCALSHYNLWKRLLKEPAGRDHYIIMEDDFSLGPNFKEKMEILKTANVFNKLDVLFMGYSMFEAERAKVFEKYSQCAKDNSSPVNITISALNKELYIGGFFMYSINKAGAEKLVKYIEQNGIKHGIDYLVKICPGLNSFETQPALCFTEWNEGGKVIDSDIQNINDGLNFSGLEEYIFIPNLDIKGADLFYSKPSDNMLSIATARADCKCFNTLGFFKNDFDVSKLEPSRYFKEKDGLYVKAKYFKEPENEDSKKNYCFIHSCHTPEKGLSILQNLIHKIVASGLLEKLEKIFVLNIGIPIEDFSASDKIQIINYSQDITLYENTSINMIHDFSLENKNANILYIHTKGILHEGDILKCVNDWINMMMYFLVEKYENCIELLNTYDAVGCNEINGKNNHFSGNFWWTTSEYISTLNKVPTSEPVDRHLSEWWILTNPNVKSKCIYNSDTNHYETRYPRNMYAPTRVKMLCNWTSSEQLCKEWSNMCTEPDKFLWNNIQLTWTNKSEEIDYYVIVNMPEQNAYFDPAKTIVFQMEPWVHDPALGWGVKTWGEWAKPDPNKFLHVHCHEKYLNNVQWQIERLPESRVDKENRICSIISSKNFDEGHILRNKFLSFLENYSENMNDVFGRENYFGFKNYRGRLPGEDKTVIGNYKYYFMCENNAEHNYATEKIWEPILCETLCFYWGCPNLGDHIDENAFVRLPLNDFEESLQIIKRAIDEDWWSQRIDCIRREKKRIIHELGFFPTLEKIIKDCRPKLFQDIKVIILTLEQFPERIENLKKKFLPKLTQLGLRYEIVYGVNGSEISVEDTEDIYIKKLTYKGETKYHDTRVRPHGIITKKGEFGCAWAHLNLYEALLKEENPNLKYLIFEDDVEECVSLEKIYNHLANLPSDFDMIHLGWSEWYPFVKKNKINKFFYDIEKRFFCRLTAYCISQKCANKILQFAKKHINVPSDDLLSNMHLLDLIKVFVPEEHLFHEPQNTVSTIGLVNSSC